MNKRLTLFVLLLICLVTLVAASLATGDAAAAPAVLINEIRIDQPSDDNDEYFELAGAASTSLNDLTYIVLGDSTAGGSGVVENVTPLTGQSMPSSGFFVAAEATFTLGQADMTTTLNFENSDNVTHMLVEGFTGAEGDDLDTNDDGTLDVTPWTSVYDTIALIKEENPPTTTEWHYGPPTVGPDGSYVPGHVFYCADGMEWKIGPFDPASGKDTPGAANICVDIPPPGDCGDPATFIHEVQGDGASSPKVGEVVVVEAVVHADFQESDELEAYFLQEEDEDADSDPKTSEGLYIDDVSFAVGFGDVVRVQGEVEEKYGRTQLTAISSSEVCKTLTGVPVPPTQILLPVPSMDRWEEVEGMSVIFRQTLYASDNYNQGRYGEVTLSVDGRLFNPTNVVPPGAPANAMQAANDLRRILLDDGSGDSNPEPPPYFAADGTLRAGDAAVMPLFGALDYSFSTYRLQPVAEVDFTRVNERTEAPAEVGGSLTVASFNVLNYFTTIDEGQDNCGPSGDMECRGADSEEEFIRQRTKIIAALSSMDADVVGLMEIENNATAAVADLVAGLNDKMGAGTYAYVDTGTVGTDAIKVAFIYKPTTVELVGTFKILDSSVDPDFNEFKNRPALAQTFEEKATGEKFTAVVNHLKSKGSDCEDVGDPDTGDGQGNCNLTRTSAAIAEAEWLATDPTGSGDPDVLIIGDLNAYAMEDPISALKAAGYQDLVARFGGEYPYSYVFFGQAGYLDHSLANQPLAPQVVGTTVWHINADEPNALNYNDYNQDGLYKPDAYRASDHDPVIVGLELGKNPQVFLPVIMTPAATSTDPFILITPADGAQLDTLIPTMKFVPNNLPENAGGCLVINELPDQTGCNMSWGTSFNDFEFVLWFNLEPNTKYYWRVGAVYDYDYDNIEWGTQRSFTSGAAGGPIPSAPILVAPANGATVSADTLTLQWQAVAGAAEYKVRVKDKVSGNGYAAAGIYPPATQAGPNEIGWIFDYADGPDFEWTIAARNDYAWGAYAPYWNFTIDGQGSKYGIDIGSDRTITRVDGIETIQR